MIAYYLPFRFFSFLYARVKGYHVNCSRSIDKQRNRHYYVYIITFRRTGVEGAHNARRCASVGANTAWKVDEPGICNSHHQGGNRSR
jgi:hypothetical protein